MSETNEELNLDDWNSIVAWFERHGKGDDVLSRKLQLVTIYQLFKIREKLK